MTNGNPAPDHLATATTVHKAHQHIQTAATKIQQSSDRVHSILAQNIHVGHSTHGLRTQDKVGESIPGITSGKHPDCGSTDKYHTEHDYTTAATVHKT